MLKDADIREPLFEYLEEVYGRVRIIEEKVIGKSRADVVMVTEDEIVGIEIKSDADSYTRLAGQVKDYDKYYDKNIVVVGTTHALHIKEHVPDWWGVITVEEIDGKADFYFYRRPQPNPKVKYPLQFHILWRPELAKLQEMYEMPKYKERSKDFVIKKFMERTELTDSVKKIDLFDLKSHMSELLMERDYTIVEDVLAEYRKGELQKKLEAETDSEARLAIMMEQAEKRSKVPKKVRRKRYYSRIN